MKLATTEQRATLDERTIRALCFQLRVIQPSRHYPRFHHTSGILVDRIVQLSYVVHEYRATMHIGFLWHPHSSYSITPPTSQIDAQILYVCW